ncbi:MAG: phosphomannomutase/phosphoglucomutase [Candidatus Magasanikbacteria bacterium]|nr:phosphomannomutase/phosphoglucomutase [Candidatus Magasanikbacteria bacterium]
MQIESSIFREYDIRGVAGVEFDPRVVAEYEKWYGAFPGVTINLETSAAIGQAYGTLIKRGGGQQVLVGHEVRPYAEQLKAAFIKGITRAGVGVTDAGSVTTPFIYWLTAHRHYDGGVNITGSHNVYFFNGFKMMKQNSAPVYGAELQTLCQMIVNDDYDLAGEAAAVTALPDAYQIYKNYLLSKVRLARPLRVVIDCGNGTPGLFAADLFTSLGCQVVKGLYLEPDAYFPNHVPDPESPLNMKDLMAAVKETKADIGIAFDADGDRVGFVNETGEFVFADEVLLLLAKDALTRHPGKKILFDVKCSQLLPELIPTLGGVPLMHRTGHAPIKDTLRRDAEVILGGEVSGHFYFVENYVKADDGFWAAAEVLRLLAASGGSVSQMFSFIPSRVRTPEIKLPCADTAKFAVVKAVTERFSATHDTITIDGVRVIFDSESWGLVRASNTSPYLTIRLEAPTAERALEIKKHLAEVLDTFPEITEQLDREHVYSPTGKLGYL